jgi:hypothetical protein
MKKLFKCIIRHRQANAAPFVDSAGLVDVDQTTLAGLIRSKVIHKRPNYVYCNKYIKSLKLNDETDLNDELLYKNLRVILALVEEGKPIHISVVIDSSSVYVQGLY